MFRAIQRADHATLRALARSFIKTRKDPIALLCLDHAFSPALELRGLSLAKIQELHSLFLDYIRLLNNFRDDELLAEGSNHQRLFGFQILEENRYIVPEDTLLYEELTAKPGLSGKSGEWICGYDELRQVIIQLISNRIYNRTEIQNAACHGIHGFSPCLHLLVRNECNPPEDVGPCTFHHIQQGQLTVEWYHTRLRLILLQFKILDLARYKEWYAVKYVSILSAGDPLTYSSNAKLLASDVVLSPSSASPEARIVRESRYHQNTRRGRWFQDRTRLGSASLR